MSPLQALRYDGLIEVHLLKVPVAIWSAAQEHIDGLLREFSLIVQDPHGDHALVAMPTRLSELIEELNDQYADVTHEQELAPAEVARTGQAEIVDLVFRVPPQASEASARLWAMLDEADTYCRAGEHLLTLAAPPELVAFRSWYLAQFIDQINGADAVAWPDYPGWPAGRASRQT